MDRSPNFEPSKQKTMMKMKLKFILMLLTMLLYSNTSKADDPDIPVIPFPHTGQDPHRAPVYQDVYALYNWNDLTLSLIVSPEIEVASVEIYQNGVQIIADSIPTLLYALSSYGSGEYTIQVTTITGIIYLGYFNI